MSTSGIAVGRTVRRGRRFTIVEGCVGGWARSVLPLDGLYEPG
jgi:hypothetical protein